ncbi:MAG: protein kinase [Isosphaeraceae bacterium]
MPAPGPGSAPRLMEIFSEALELTSEDERAAYLNRVCGTDSALKRRVEGLLRAHVPNDGFLEPRAAVSRANLTTTGSNRIGLGTTIGPYRLVETLGEGGMGIVYVAEQARPVRREVALKVVKPGMDSRQVIARFEAERQALAMMDHPNIAKVHDAGTTSSGHPYFVMELVRGLPITEYCNRERLSIRERLELFVLVCRAVQHAHQKGVIHRDLKPSNILVVLHDDVPVPKIIDFGIAKATGQSLTEKTVFTAMAQLVGTPHYMSPEQVELSGLDIDTRSDIYSLGVLLYELLTGTTPFDPTQLRCAAFDEMRRIIREQEPPRPSTRLDALGDQLTAVGPSRDADPRRLSRTIRGELDWIAMKALEKDRHRRYETANNFADDVLNYLTDRPVEACSPSPWYRIAKFTRRNRPLLVTSTTILLTLITCAVVSAWQAVRATRAERWAQDQRRLAERHLYAARLRQARETLDRGQAERAQEILTSLCPAPGETDHRAFVWDYLWGLARRDIGHFDGSSSRIRLLETSADGRFVATDSKDGTIFLWDVSAERLRTQLAGHESGVALLTFSGDGRLLASLAAPSAKPGSWEVRVWDTSSGSRVAELSGIKATTIWKIAFTPTGRRLVILWGDGATRTTHIDHYELAADPRRPTPVQSRVYYKDRGVSHQGPFVAVAEENGPLTCYDVETLTPLWSLAPIDTALGWPTFSPDGRWIAAEDGSTAVVLDTATGRPHARFRVGRPSDVIARMRLCLDGSTLLVVYESNQAALFDLRGRSPSRPIRVQYSKSMQYLLTEARLSPDGSRFALIGDESRDHQRRVMLWDAATGKRLREYPGRRMEIDDVTFTHDGRSLLLAGEGGLRRWRLERAEDTPPDALVGHTDEAWAAAFSDRGELLATGGDDSDDPQTIKLWEPASGRLRLGWSGGRGTVSSLAFAPDGMTLASAHLDESGRIRLWDPASGRLRESLVGHTGKVRTVAYRRDGAILASGGDDRTIRLWNGASGAPIRTLMGHEDKVRQVVFSPDGSTLASAGNDETVRIWDVDTGRVVRTLRTSEDVTSVGYSPDGKLLAATDETGMLLLWDTRTGEPIWRENGEDGALRYVVFSPDGKTLVAGSASGRVRFWDPLTGQELLVLEGHKAQVNALAFSPDGRLLVSTSHDGSVKLWRADERRPSP